MGDVVACALELLKQARDLVEQRLTARATLSMSRSSLVTGSRDSSSPFMILTMAS